MSFIFRLLFIALLLVGGGVVVAALMIFEDSPLVPGSNLMSASDLQQARVFLENSDPRNLEPGEISAFTMKEQDLELLLNYLLGNLHGGRTSVDMAEGSAHMALSARLPGNILGEYLNVQVFLSQSGDVLVLENLQIGSLKVPGWIADAVMKRTHEELKNRIPEYVAALDAVNGYSISNDQINVTYQWQPELLEQISNRGRDLLISEADKERLIAHAQNLAAITQNPDLPVVVSLAELLGPMFQFARSRQGEPVEENRAALLALSMYVMGINASTVLGDSASAIPAMGRHQVTLSGRRDFARHFLVSAGLAISAGTGLADSIGLLKELDDSQDGGSGFSFTDLAADRTGVRFADLAVADQDQALAVQEALAGPLSEAVFMAEFRDLPEFIPEDEFRRLYGSVGEPAYNQVLADIEVRIGRTPLFARLE